MGGRPTPISDEVRKMVIGDEEVITTRPADLLEPELDKARSKIEKYLLKEEDVLTYIMFPEVALGFLKNR